MQRPCRSKMLPLDAVCDPLKYKATHAKSLTTSLPFFRTSPRTNFHKPGIAAARIESKKEAVALDKDRICAFSHENCLCDNISS